MQKIIGWLGGLGIAAAIVGGLFLFGYDKGYGARESVDAAAQKKADAAWQSKLDAANKKGDQLAGELAIAKSKTQTVVQTVIQKIPSVTTVYKEKPGAPSIPLPRAVFTVGFVGLWNAALDPADQPGLSAPAVGAAATPSESDLVDSGVAVSDILANHAVNAGQYADCRAQLVKLIQFETTNGTTKSPQ